MTEDEATLEPLVSVAEAAGLVGCHPATLVRMIRRGDLKALKLGRQYRLRVSDLEPSFIHAPITKHEPPRKPAGKFARLAAELSRSGARSARG